MPLRLASSEVICEDRVPSVDTALALAEAAGHNFRRPTVYGEDPLAAYPHLVDQRLMQFRSNLNMEEVYNSIISGSCDSFKIAIDMWLNITSALSKVH